MVEEGNDWLVVIARMYTKEGVVVIARNVMPTGLDGSESGMSILCTIYLLSVMSVDIIRHCDRALNHL